MNYKVNGIEKIQEYFKGYGDCYCIIDGTACYMNFYDIGLDFRATKDIDLVVISNQCSEDFIKVLIKFISDGQYANNEKSCGKPQLYRFTKPQKSGYPYMIELFCERELVLNGHVGKIDIENERSLSGILLDSDYYNLLVDNMSTIDGVSVASIVSIIMLKIHAWINPRESDNKTDVNNSNKHYADIFQLSEAISEKDNIKLVESIRSDFNQFVSNNESSFSAEELEKINILKKVLL